MYLKSHWDLFKHKDKFENTLKFTRFDNESEGNKIVTFTQHYKGIILSHNIIDLVLNSKNDITSLQNSTIPIPKNFKTESKLDENKAKIFLAKFLNKFSKYKILSVTKGVNFTKGTPILEYLFKVKLLKYSKIISIHIDAHNGNIIEILDNSVQVNGRGKIFTVDPISQTHGEFGKKGLINQCIDPVTQLPIEDCASDELKAIRKTIDLLDITEAGGVYKLIGPNVKIFDKEEEATELADYNNSTSDFFFDRSHKQFEAVMCYYYLDKSIRYVEGIGFGIQPTLEFDPHNYNGGIEDPSSFYLYGKVWFANGTRGSTSDLGGVDQAEDAQIIYHELGHFLHDVLTGYSNDFSGYEGLTEGFGDYWAISEANGEQQYKSWELENFRIFRWANWNPYTVKGPSGSDRWVNRVANSDLTYPQSTDQSNWMGQFHNYGQIFSTVLMKIYYDLGKYKTDWAVLQGMKLAKSSTATRQPKAATDIFNAAKNSTNPYYTDDELCIMWTHFDNTYNTPQNNTQYTFDGELRMNTPLIPDVYMKDDYADVGIEANTFSGDYWHSEDIWVKNDGKNDRNYNQPKYGISNSVKVNVRAKNCLPLTNGILKVYWSKGSTGQKWPVDWNGSRTYNNFPLGGMVGQFDLSTLSWSAGEEHTISIPWTTIPNPAGSNYPGWLGYSFLARIDVDPNKDPNIDTPDPLHNPNQSNLNIQARNENNVIWRNNHIYTAHSSDPEISTVLIKDPTESFMVNNNCIEIRNSDLPYYGSILDCGELYIDLKEPLKSLWEDGGMQGTNFSEQEDGTLKVLSLPMQLCNLNLILDTMYFADVIAIKNNDLLPFSFEMRHMKNSSIVIGGFRFMYSGVDSVALPRARDEKVDNKDDDIVKTIFPNPCYNSITIQLNRNFKSVKINLYDVNGREVITSTLPDIISKNIHLDLGNINYTGLLFIKLTIDNQSKTFRILKL